MCKLTGGDFEHTGGASPDPTQGRELLPTNVIPTHYDVTLEPDFEKFTFQGTALIEFDVKDETKSISLHTIEIDIHSAHLKDGDKIVTYVVPRVTVSYSSTTDRRAQFLLGDYLR
jgi:aminopeptidase 2